MVTNKFCDESRDEGCQNMKQNEDDARIEDETQKEPDQLRSIATPKKQKINHVRPMTPSCVHCKRWIPSSSATFRSPYSCRKQSHRSSSLSPGRDHSSPLFGNPDRFVPDRSQLQVDHCRARILFAEQQRRTPRRGAEDRRCQQRAPPVERDDHRNLQASFSSSASLSLTMTTRLQSEFQIMMESALLDTALIDERSHYRTISGTSSLSLQHRQRPSIAGRMIIENDLTRSPSYENFVNSSASFVSLVEGEGFTLDFMDRTNGISGSRTLEGSELQQIEETASFPGTTPSLGVTEGQRERILFYHHRRGSSCPSSSIIDPFRHDHLRVLERTMSERSRLSRVGGGKGLWWWGQHQHNSNVDSDPWSRSVVARTVGRRIPSTPLRVLDAPDIVDDYYLNLVSWGLNNMLAVALGRRVYLWNPDTAKINRLVTLSGENDYVTSVSWSTNPGEKNIIAVGTKNSTVQIWDVEQSSLVRTLRGCHTARVGSLAWSSRLVLSSGSRDSLIVQHDIRAINDHVSTFGGVGGHTQEVCGLKWNEDGRTLASGGNENLLCLWDAAMSSQRRSGSLGASSDDHIHNPRIVLRRHSAAVKALGWCPHRSSLLASGGGTADRSIKFWDANSGSLLDSVDTGSQVCSLLWSKHRRGEICSSHGYSENQLVLWSYPTMTKLQEFTGHTARVLHMEQSPDGSCVVSAAADETLRFWDVFGQPPKKTINSTVVGNLLSVGITEIR